MSIRFHLVAVASLALVASSCSLAAHTKGSRESGQSNAMGDTFAGKNACNPENHLRPFIIEWDATDMSSFEQHAANDIVFVAYEGCSMRVLDECRNESIRGEQGAYKPVEWTSGALETLDVNNAAELYAKLPLGQATLGGRVEGGEKFHMEYYVAGTRTASRDAVYRSDLEGKYGCEKATHFVYGYNLGAFALASSKNITASAGGSAFGFGAGGSESRSSSAEKKGGKLTVCDSDSAKEVEGCKAPIRVTLRDIRPGENPEKTAMAAPDTAESLTAAAIVNTKIEMNDEAKARIEAMQRKVAAKDGPGCIKELDAYDKLNPKSKSTDPQVAFAMNRAMCLMMAGKCDPGKTLMRKYWESTGQMMAEQVDKNVDVFAGLYCQGKMNDYDTYTKAYLELQKGAYQGNIGKKACEDAHATMQKLHDKVKPKNDDDNMITGAKTSAHMVAANCLARAGACDRAYLVYADRESKQEWTKKVTDKAQLEKLLKDNFQSIVAKCKGKI